ncbi:hypothetical protein L1987_09373 [Smallanthus sonchifolius]|uniref:Uncharacterized protein n=1 Tax=Smallanthus sonchifolius TaxID=185202 RepID=A0ACB9JPF8_9ASTR|nr:hypothetical protein L1987_09373 [Smallanthus sonchifolius]
MGARKIVVTDIPPIGCCPYQRDHNPFSGRACVAFPNDLAQQYNQQLKQMLIELTKTLKGMTFVYVDVYRMIEDVVKNYESYDKACCRMLGLHGGMVPCLQHAKICEDRSKYVFWYWFHVTEKTNVITAKRILDGEINDISPVNVRALSQI